MRFYVKDQATGRVIRYGRCPDGEHIHQAAPGEVAVEVAEDHPPIDDRIHHEVDGVLVAKPMDQGEMLFHLRRERDRRLRAIDHTRHEDVPMAPEVREAYATYRQALRDWPANPDQPPPVLVLPKKEAQ